MIIYYFSVLGTPSEDTWPGVSSLADYKADFPSWSKVSLEKLIPNLDSHGLDLLEKMLIFNPAKRITAKRFIKWQYK